MKIPNNPKSAYAPIRYEATRPYAPVLGKAYAAACRRGEKARKTFVNDDLVPLLEHAIAKMRMGNGARALQAEHVNVQVFGGFQDGGKIIFDVTSAFTRSLLVTDAENIPCGELEFPAGAFYLHFGSTTARHHDGFSLEGAFVAFDSASNNLIIDLVPCGFGQPHFIALDEGEPLVGTHIDLSDRQKPITQALHDSIASIMHNNAKTLEETAEMERALAEKYGEIISIPHPILQLEDNETLLQSALSLIVNTLFYLMAEPDDIVDDWESETPPEALVALAGATLPGQQRTLTNTLVNAGYRRVRVVGRRFANSVSDQHFPTMHGEGGHRAVATHFFFSVAEAASLIAASQERPAGVNPRAWQWWETGQRPVPIDVEARLRALCAWRERMIDVIEETLAEAETDGEGAFIWYSNLDDWASIEGREPQFWRPHCSVRAEVASRYPKVILVEFNGPEYSKWLGKRKDTESARAVWGAEMTRGM